MKKIITLILFSFLILPSFAENTKINKEIKKRYEKVYSGNHTGNKDFVESFEKLLIPNKGISTGNTILKFNKKQDNKLFNVKIIKELSKKKEVTKAKEGAYLVTENKLIFALKNGERSFPNSGIKMKFKYFFVEVPIVK